VNTSNLDQQALTDRYRPLTVDGFVGLDKPRRAMTALLARPFPSAWLFVGPPGVGKTSMGLAVAAQLPAELHHIPSRRCDLETIEDVTRMCHYAPCFPAGARFHVVLVDEADHMTPAAQLALLSKLDATAFPPATIFVFTANSTEGLDSRFLSRCRVLEFSSYGLAQPAADLLTGIWDALAPAGAVKPDVRRILKESTNNVRDALNKLELELMTA
jgi:replication-associated recombination protein RarA